MPYFDIACEACGNVFEEKLKNAKEPTSCCPKCGSAFTKQVWLSFPSIDRAKDPFDYLDGRIPDPRKTKVQVK